MEIEENFNNENNEKSIINENNEKSKKKGIFLFSKISNMQNRLSRVEIRLKKDYEECKNNIFIGKICKIVLNDYSKNENTNNFEMIIELVSHFSLKFIFTHDYPFEPPIISFYKGNKYKFLFDPKGNIILNITKKEKWTPTLWLSTLIHHIEIKIKSEFENISSFCNIYDEFNNNRIGKSIFSKKEHYNKRNWNDYLNGILSKDSIKYLEFSELKQYKDCNYNSNNYLNNLIIK